MKVFTDSDIETVKPYGAHNEREYKRISADRDDLIDAPMWYHLKGLSQTASGYGRKLNTGLKLNLNGRLYRIYCTIFSNSGTNWISVRGERIVVS